jgi:dTDP-4-amino-4,6-dideoxygalactose transaminase
LAYHLVGIKEGDEVISTPITCTATNSPLVNRGAKIVWADVELETGNIDPNSIEKLINAFTRAIVIVDWSGRECDTKKIREIAGDIPVIEDAAHVFHRKEHGYPDNWYTVYSFGPIKHLTTGDGGAIIVPNKQYERAKLLRWYGLDRDSNESFRCRQNIKEVGYKYHMNDINASIGMANFKLAEESVEKARANAKYYDEHLSGVIKPIYDESSSWWFYDIRVDKRDKFIEYCAEHGISASPVHKRNDLHTGFPKCYNLEGVGEYDNTHVAIPVGWWLSKDDIEYIAKVIGEWNNE